MRFILYFWSFEISEHILRNQNLIIGLVSYSRQHFIYLDPILIYISLWIDCLFEIHKTAAWFPLHFVWMSLQGHWWGFFSRNFEVWPIYFLTNVFTALKGTHFCIFNLESHLLATSQNTNALVIKSKLWLLNIELNLHSAYFDPNYTAGQKLTDFNIQTALFYDFPVELLHSLNIYLKEMATKCHNKT